MGLIKALIGTVGGTLGDQWKEFFYCEALPADVLVVKGQKRSSSRSANTSGNENIISNGSTLAVANGQCAIIVEQGVVVEICAEPGEYTYDTSTEPSIFAGESFGQGVKDMFNTMKKRFTYGGDTGKDQRIYYFNLKEIIGNKYGTQNPVPFRVVDKNIGLDIDIAIRCNGEYSYKLTNPILFYNNVCGNVETEYLRTEIDSQLKSELMTALQPAFAKISALGVRYSALPGHTQEIAEALNEVLSAKWSDLRGISVASFGVNSVSASKEDEDMIKQLQKSAVMRDPTMAAATLVGAQADAMRAAASNEGGAMMGFMGLGMAQSVGGGMGTQNLFAMGQQQAPPQPPPPPPQSSVPPTPPPQPAATGWTCACGAVNTGKFCLECGKPKPTDGWPCSCGTINKGKFCAECGQPKPAGTPTYQCDKCGWQPEDPSKPPKFCPECGDIFDESDAGR
jgi:membrane protease subunit (stomatin/prohibitin family)